MGNDWDENEVSPRTVNVLLVEDDEVDAEGIKRALRRQRIANPLVNAWDGMEALEILRGTNGRSALPKPYLILLDLNMPRLNGLEFLEEVRNDPELQDSVVFVLTTSKSDEDRVSAYKFNVAGYIVKAEVGEGFVNLVQMLDSYWRIVELP